MLPPLQMPLPLLPPRSRGSSRRSLRNILAAAPRMNSGRRRASERRSLSHSAGAHRRLRDRQSRRCDRFASRVGPSGGGGGGGGGGTFFTWLAHQASLVLSRLGQCVVRLRECWAICSTFPWGGSVSATTFYICTLVQTHTSTGCLFPHSAALFLSTKLCRVAQKVLLSSITVCHMLNPVRRGAHTQSAPSVRPSRPQPWQRYRSLKSPLAGMTAWPLKRARVFRQRSK